ncbi:MAG: FAD-binding oxidoreductase [Marivibrio sp.]|uniref:FAD-binding oxidoreductase n=1 Tax=Marivibrio sp. TaxID=2039719 RepID=UPI0032ED4E78
MPHTVEILEVADVTHNVRRLTVQKPEGYEFTPGQATDVALDREGWREERRPFTFTSLTTAPTLEFVIKVYDDHDGVTKQIGDLKKGDRLIIDEPWGAIQYKGPGCFVAGGAGLTPFIAIIRDLQARGELDGNTLLFSNKTERDIILREELEGAPGLETLFTVTQEENSSLAQGRIDEAFLKANLKSFERPFYVCGPDKMVEDVTKALQSLGAKPDSIVFEE